MRNRARRPLLATIAISLVALLALPMAVLATTTDAIAQTGGMTATLPLLGSSLTVEVTLDESGNLSAVNLDPVGTFSASKLTTHAVSFDNADGTAKVKIKAKGDKLAIHASAGSLDALIGPGTWSADVFGTGAKSSVAYRIGKAADGSPTVTVDSVNAAAGITAVEGTPKSGSHDDEHDDEHGASASATVAFSRDGYTKRLTIRVSVESKGEKHASLKLSLSGKDRQRLSGTLEQLVGAHTWSGKLCGGTAVTIGYTVLADGTVVYGSATGGTVTVKTREHGFTARFDGTEVKVTVGLKQLEDGLYSLKTSAKRGGCLHQQVPLPTVNSPVQPGADQPADHKGDDKGDAKSDDKSDAKSDDKGGRDGGDHGGGSGEKDHD